MKEELSGLIGELKNDVDDKGTKIEEDRKVQQIYIFQLFLLAVNPHFCRKAQEAAFEALNNELKEIREEFKTEGLYLQHGFPFWSFSFEPFVFLVKENKESALEAQNQLREEILGKLEDTNKNIDQVQTRILTRWKK